jgi:hypothetical protein
VTDCLHLLMHGTAIKKHGSVADIAAIAGVAAPLAANVLDAAVLSGRVVAVDGKFMLSPAGQMIVLAEYSRFCAGLRANTEFVGAYTRFETINHDLKQLITNWQTVELGGKRVANDHSNAEYDDRVIAQLGDLHERFEPTMTALVGAESRYTVYQAKLNEALEKAEDGDSAWVSDARIDSYHTVWFELHEDLLRVLGREREE